LSTKQQGLLYGLAAYGWWGLVPLFFKELTAARVPPFEVFAHRIVWSLALLAGLLVVLARWGDLLRCLRSPRLLRTLLVTTLLIAVNWYFYIYAVDSNQLVQASLGYFITPLVNVVLGIVFLRERLRRLQWWAVGLAALGVVLLTVAARQPPWIALAVAFSFGFYGLLRKQLPVDGLTGLSVETLFLLPFAAGYLLYLGWTGALALGHSARLDALLLCSGVVTAVPLLCFGQAARRLPLTLLSFLQYLSPSMQLLMAVALYHEPFPLATQVSLACICLALVLLSADSLLTLRGRPPVAAPDPVLEKPQ
jgi:chloramphenicol-sensitive protein RarD